MKRTLSFMVMALALLLTQCRKPEVKFPSPVATEGTTVSMTVTAGPGSKTDITTAGAITWSSGDKLYVGFDGKYVGCLELVNGGSATGTFRGNVTLPDASDGEKTFGFFYLGRDNGVVPLLNATTVDVSFATQEIYADANNKLANASKYHVGYGRANGTVKDGVVTGINVTLVSKVALARFSFKKAADGTPYTDALTLSGNNIYNSMTVNFNGTLTGTETGEGKINLTNTTVSEKYVMLVPAGATAATLNFGGEYEGATELAQGIEANKYYGQGGPIGVVLTKAPVPVTGVTLNKISLSLVVGGTATLEAIVEPDDATDPSVTWVSDDEDVATVDDNGVVTAVAAGEATIRVTTVDGGNTAECAVTVTAPALLGWFTINAEGDKVEFSPGNLYWDGSAFKFEANQWDYRHYRGRNGDAAVIGGVSGKTPSGTVGSFWWSKTASLVYAYSYSDSGASTSDVFFTNASDFQVNGETAGTWRTLSKAEWDYLLNSRTSASSLRAWVTLTDVSVSGLVLLPDSSTATASGITTSSAVAEAGAVFLPAAGSRTASNIINVGTTGCYWTNTINGSGSAWSVLFGETTGPSLTSKTRGCGYFARLVR